MRPVAGPADLDAARAAVAKTSVSPEITGYVVDICRATRDSPSLTLGVSPRGATALLSTARAWAWLTGRDYVIPDDVKALALPTLRHRVQLRPEAEMEGVTADSVINADPRPRPRPPLIRRDPHRTHRRSIAALGALLVGFLLPGWTGMLAVELPLLMAILCDLALAAPVRSSDFTRSGDTSVRLGERADVDADRHQPLRPPAARPTPRRLAPEQLAAGHRQSPQPATS